VARFGHREHLELAWSCVRAEGMPAAGDTIAAFIRGVAAREGVPDRYHETVTRFWTRLIAFAIAAHPESSFDELLARAPHLMDKSLPARHWSAERLRSKEARSGWVEPDLAALP
jgi:hypothetical protein